MPGPSFLPPSTSLVCSPYQFPLNSPRSAMDGPHTDMQIVGRRDGVVGLVSLLFVPAPASSTEGSSNRTQQAGG